MARSERVLVIGGGVVGLCCAYVLRQRGHEVTVADSARMGAACSAGNGGSVCPSLSAPLPGPGVIASSLRWMFRSDSPLLLRPGLDPTFWTWLLAFARNCNAASYDRGLRAVAALALPSFQQFSALQEAGVEFELHRDGLLLLFVTELAAKREMEALQVMEGLGCPAAEWLDREELTESEPATAGRSVAGIRAPQDQHVRPESLTAGLEAWLRRSGVDLLENTRISQFRLEDSRVMAAHTEGGAVMEADQFVLAAGVGTRRLADQLRLRIPLRGGKGYSVTYQSCAPRLEVPLYLTEAKVAISPFQDAVRVLGTMELGTDDRPISRARVEGMLKACHEYLPNLSLSGPAKPWSGLRPIVPDGIPVIGTVPKVTNATVATGHAMLGVTLGPSTGELVADLVEGVAVPAYTSAFSPGRF